MTTASSAATPALPLAWPPAVPECWRCESRTLLATWGGGVKCGSCGQEQPASAGAEVRDERDTSDA